MDKEKFHIPMPDEHTIQRQIEKIVTAGVKRKESFLSYLKSMYQQVGFRHLFSDRSELVYILITAITLLGIFFISPDPARAQMHDLYAFIFLTSPVLFLTLTIYTYSNKIMNATYEVEMACKYNVYQIIAFRMFAFSFITILVNTVTILLMVRVYEDIQFFRAFMISITGLFTFSILFLYVMMNRRSTVVVAMTVIGWTLGNLLLRYMDNKFYSNVLVNMPLIVYALVLIGSIYFYLRYLNRLIHFKHAEGDF